MASEPTAGNRAIWERLAPWWDELVGDDGDTFHRRVIRPDVLTMLEPLAGERVLDVGCGNGGLARQLAEREVRVVAVDQAEAFIRVAQARPHPNIEFRVIDATAAEQLAELGGAPFDAAVANMVLMDMPKVAPLFAALPTLLRPGGRFVFSIIHPCFGYGTRPAVKPAAPNGSMRLSAHAAALTERLVSRIPPGPRMWIVEQASAFSAGRASLHYLESQQMPAQVSPDQPVAHWYFHRPLYELLNTAFAAGLVLDRMAEPPYWDRHTGQTGLLIGRLRTGRE